MTEEKEELKQGWVCPMCGNVYAPTVEKCSDCKDKTVQKEGADKKKEVLKG
jgi:uncharacterized OB-fold protein